MLGHINYLIHVSSSVVIFRGQIWPLTTPVEILEYGKNDLCVLVFYTANVCALNVSNHPSISNQTITLIQ